MSMRQEKRKQIELEAMGKIDGYFGGQRGKNAALAHAVMDLFDHVEELFRMNGTDTCNSHQYQRLQNDRAKLVHYDRIINEMHRCLNELETCDINDQECIESVKPNWPKV